MGEFFRTISGRWKAKSPKIFRRIYQIAFGTAFVAVTIHTALNETGADTPEWFSAIYPYLVSASAGMGAVAKLTQQYDKDGKPIRDYGNGSV